MERRHMASRRAQPLARLSVAVRKNPYPALAAAAGTGYVLGGGITPRVILGLCRIGGRATIGALAQKLVAQTLFPKPTSRA